MDNNYQIVSCDLNAQNAQSVVFETGILAEQASGAVTVRSGDSVVFKCTDSICARTAGSHLYDSRRPAAGYVSATHLFFHK